MIPVRTVAPLEAVVPLEELKEYLAVDFSDNDRKIAALQDAAVAFLDGYRGVLGRCIMKQTWQVSYPCAGVHRLPFPDVETAEADAGQATVSQDSLGSLVTLTQGATVTITAQCPPDILASVKQIVCMMVDLWYNDTSLVGTMPPTVDALLGPIRWVRV